jgi:hypothetical protein
MKEKRNTNKILVVNSRGNHLEGKIVAGRIMFNLILENECGRMWLESSDRSETSVGVF